MVDKFLPIKVQNLSEASVLELVVIFIPLPLNIAKIDVVIYYPIFMQIG